MYMLLLLIVLQNDAPIILQSTHAPFETEQACEDYATFLEPRTNELIAKMIDQGAEVTDHKTHCQKMVDERPS